MTKIGLTYFVCLSIFAAGGCRKARLAELAEAPAPALLKMDVLVQTRFAAGVIDSQSKKAYFIVQEPLASYGLPVDLETFKPEISFPLAYGGNPVAAFDAAEKGLLVAFSGEPNRPAVELVKIRLPDGQITDRSPWALTDQEAGGTEPTAASTDPATEAAWIIVDPIPDHHAFYLGASRPGRPNAFLIRFNSETLAEEARHALPAGYPLTRAAAIIDAGGTYLYVNSGDVVQEIDLKDFRVTGAQAITGAACASAFDSARRVSYWAIPTRANTVIRRLPLSDHLDFRKDTFSFQENMQNLSRTAVISGVADSSTVDSYWGVSGDPARVVGVYFWRPLPKGAPPQVIVGPRLGSAKTGALSTGPAQASVLLWDKTRQCLYAAVDHPKATRIGVMRVRMADISHGAPQE